MNAPIEYRNGLEYCCAWCEAEGLVPATQPGQRRSHGICRRHMLACFGVEAEAQELKPADLTAAE